MTKIINIDNFEIKKLDLPKIAIVPLKVVGKSIANPIVKLNQTVLKGQMIATTKDENGVNVYSPIYGQVIGFDLYPLSNRENSYCIFIENLEQNQSIINDSILKAKLDAMKINANYNFNENRYNIDENMLHSDKNMQDNVEVLQERKETGEAILQERSQALNKMFSSKNEHVNFNLEEICKEFEKENAEKESEIQQELFETNGVKEEKFLPYSQEENLLDFISHCAVLTQNGESLSNVLKQEKTIIIPCYDCLPYASENMAVLVNYFDEIYQTLEILQKQLEKKIILLYRKGDQLPDMESIWQGQTESGIYKLCVKKTNSNFILKNYFNIIDESKIQKDYENLNNHFSVLSPTTLYHLHKALCFGIPQTTTLITIGGQGLSQNGVYEVSSGCTLEHLQQCLGGTTSEQDIEDDKSDAMEAVSDYYEYLEQFKDEKEQTKKKQMKVILQEKKKLANKLTKNYVKTCKKNLKKCLGQIAFDNLDYGETHGNFQAVCELKNRRVYYLSVSQC